jgi:uncharacterized protein YyaL (SSP411 family)
MAIAWREWGADAFHDAKALDRPIVLSISATWCHWCHIMDENGWADEEVQEIIAREFVPIRVDTDRRPDINQRYNLGGWPTTAILTPTGEVLTGGTYIPPDDLKRTLRDIVRVYHSRKADIYAEVLRRRGKREELHPSGGELTEETAKQARAEIEKAMMRSFDPVYGGFGVAPKFPALDPLEYSLNRATTTGDERFRNIALQTLKAMATGGLWDPVEGGFFRYATREDWTVPHYEKMLEDNARLVEILSRAGHEFSETLLKERSRVTMSYLRRTLRDKETGFYFGSQDASEEYYALTSLEERMRAGAPAIDRTVYVGWNALTARALLRAGLFWDDPESRAEGLRLADALLDRIAEEGPLAHCWNGPSLALDYLEDYVWLAEALMEAFEETGSSKYVARLEALFGRARQILWDEERGAYRDIPARSDAPGREQEPRYPLSENSRMAVLLARWSALTGTEEAHAQNGRIAGAFQRVFPAYGIFSSSYAEALAARSAGAARIVVVADRNMLGANDAGGALEIAARNWGSPAKIVIPARAVEFAGAEASTVTGPAALVCFGRVCLPPVRDPDALRKALTAHLR